MELPLRINGWIGLDRTYRKVWGDGVSMGSRLVLEVSFSGEACDGHRDGSSMCLLFC